MGKAFEETLSIIESVIETVDLVETEVKICEEGKREDLLKILSLLETVLNLVIESLIIFWKYEKQ